MNGREIRTKARTFIYGKRKTLLLAGMFVYLPGIVIKTINIVLSIFYQTGIPLWVSYLFSALSFLLSFGLIFIAVEFIRGRNCDLHGLFFVWTKKKIGKAIVLMLSITLLNRLFVVVPNLLSLWGQELINKAGGEPIPWVMMDSVSEYSYHVGKRLKLAASVLSMLVGLLLSGILFPIRYRFVLQPEDSLICQFWEGCQLGLMWFWEIIKFQFWIYLPIAGVVSIQYTVSLIADKWFINELFLVAVVSYAANITFVCWYIPYLVLSNSAFVMAMTTGRLNKSSFMSGHKGMKNFVKWLSLSDREKKPAEKRYIKLNGRGGWYWCVIGKGPVWREKNVCKK